MSSDTNVYNATIRLFGSYPDPAFESDQRQTSDWGRVWGCDNDVGALRLVLMHRPGDEFSIIDPGMRITETGSFGDLEAGWYWQSREIPPLAHMQQQHDALVAALRAEGVEVVFLDGVDGGRFKSCYTRDSSFAIKGGAVVCRMAPRMRHGEELVATRTLARLGMPILRTVHGNGMLEGGSFAWLNSRTAVVGRGIRVNDAAIAQLAQVLAVQGVELLVVDLRGYDIHIDGALVMLDVDLALIDPQALPHAFLGELARRGIVTLELGPDDNPWIINSLAVRPGRVLMPEGLSAYTRERLDEHGVEVVTVAYDAMQLNGGGIHCSTCPLVRDRV